MRCGNRTSASCVVVREKLEHRSCGNLRGAYHTPIIPQPSSKTMPSMTTLSMVLVLSLKRFWIVQKMKMPANCAAMPTINRYVKVNVLYLQRVRLLGAEQRLGALALDNGVLQRRAHGDSGVERI